MKKLIHKPHCGFLEKMTFISFCISPIVWLSNKKTIYILLVFSLFAKLIMTYKFFKEHGNGIILNKNILSYEKSLYIKRSMIADIQLLIISLIILIINNINLNFDFITIGLGIYIVFAIICYFCYVCKNSYLKCIPIIISTPIGLIVLMFFIILLCLLLNKLIIFIDNYINVSIPSIIKSTLSLISIVEKDISFWIFSTVIFCILNFTYILSTPKYHLKAIKNSYGTITLIASLMALIAILASPFLSKELINIVKTRPELLDNNTSAIEYFNNFSETNMRNIITLILIPYSIGLILCNAFINVRISRANAKKDKMAKKLLTETNEKLIEEEKIEFLINGGKSVELDYIDQIRINSCKS